MTTLAENGPALEGIFLPKDKGGSQFIVKGNPLIQSHYKLTMRQSRLLTLLIGKIQRNDEPDTRYIINSSDLLRALKHPNFSDHQYLEDQLDALAKTLVKIKVKKKTTTTGFIRIHEIDEEAGTIAYEFNPEIQPFLFQLVNWYTGTRYDRLCQLKTFAAFRLYELIILRAGLNRDKGDVFAFEEEYGDLRSIAGVNNRSYPKFSAFSRHVLIPAQKNINRIRVDGEPDLVVEFLPEYVGKKVRRVSFRVLIFNEDLLLRRLPKLDEPELENNNIRLSNDVEEEEGLGIERKKRPRPVLIRKEIDPSIRITEKVPPDKIFEDSYAVYDDEYCELHNHIAEEAEALRKQGRKKLPSRKKVKAEAA